MIQSGDGVDGEPRSYLVVKHALPVDERLLHACFADEFDPRVIIVVTQLNETTAVLKALYIAKHHEGLSHTFREEADQIRLVREIKEKLVAPLK